MKNSAFTIVEIAITLVIISLLIAAITAGQSIKHRLELKQVIDDITTIRTGIETFKSTYGANSVPGDYESAETAFGENAVGNKIADGNGDGDGDGDTLIETNLTSPERDESLLFWQHLAAISAITGTYDGSTDGPGGRMEGPIKNSIYGISTTRVGLGGLDSDIHMYISRYSSGSDGYGILTPKESFDYDQKYDDGDPETGTIRALDGTGESSGDCVSGTTPNLNYNITNKDDKACVVHFYYINSL